MLDKSDSLALVLQSMEVGTLPIIFTNNDRRVQIAKVTMSALTLYTLSKVSRLIWRDTEEKSIPISTVDEIMNVLRGRKGED